uniref:Uncharacterized protein n=1 Tax=Anguilla anguilla TaxID=7936 RepID=A0A0E9QNZ1_ANGAN
MLSIVHFLVREPYLEQLLNYIFFYILFFDTSGCVAV